MTIWSYMSVDNGNTHHIGRVDDVETARVDGYQDLGIAIEEKGRQRASGSLDLAMEECAPVVWQGPVHHEAAATDS